MWVPHQNSTWERYGLIVLCIFELVALFHSTALSVLRPVSYCQSRFPATVFCRELAEKNSTITRCTNCNCAFTFFASSLQMWYTVSNIDSLRTCSSPEQKVVSDTGWGQALIPVLFLIVIIGTVYTLLRCYKQDCLCPYQFSPSASLVLWPKVVTAYFRLLCACSNSRSTYVHLKMLFRFFFPTLAILDLQWPPAIPESALWEATSQWQAGVRDPGTWNVSDPFLLHLRDIYLERNSAR